MIEVGLIIRKAATFGRLAPDDRKLIFVALALLGVVRTALWILPFRRVVRFFQNCGRWRLQLSDYAPSQLAWAVRLASRYVPRATCLAQALTMYVLLSRRGFQGSLKIGVVSTPRFESHAWVECDEKVIFGAWEKQQQYTTILTLKTQQPDP